MVSPAAGGTRDPRGTWLVLATDGPALSLTSLADVPAAIRAVSDPGAFIHHLTNGRPRVAILAEPPAGPQEVALTCHERRRRHGLRVIHVSPASAVERRIAALRDGFDDAVPASIDAVELAERARLLDERSRTQPSTTIHVGDDLELDLLAHELRANGQAVHLRPKEFQLLALLAGHPGRAYTRRQLLDRIWGPRTGDPRTVDVHIRWLRSKIEPIPERPVLLVTVRGVGYRLDLPIDDDRPDEGASVLRRQSGRPLTDP